MAKEKKPCKVISVVNQKGGVGKTTSAINLATAFAAVGKKTLFLDLDPQGNGSTGLGVPAEARGLTVYDALVGRCTLEAALLPTAIPNLSVIPATVDLSAIDVELANEDMREYRLKNLISDLRQQFDYIYIDCPPSLGLLTINALTASDSVIIPLQCEFFALEGLTHLLQTLSLVQGSLNPDLDIDGVVLTMYDRRNRLTTEVEDDVRGYLGEKVYKTVIPRNVKISEAPSFGKPAIIYDFRCPGSQAYLHLAREVLKRAA